MLFAESYRVLREEEGVEASADTFIDSDKVEDVAEDLGETMDSIPYVDGEAEKTNGGVPFTAEMCNLIKCESGSLARRSRPRFMLELAVLQHFMEANEEEDAGEAVEQIADANSGEDESGADVTITSADVVVVAPSDEEVKEIVDAAVEEATLMKKPGLAVRRLNELAETIDELKKKGVKIVKKKSKKAKK